MSEKSYRCVLCGNDFTSEEPPKRCPACLSSKGVQEAALASGGASRGAAKDGGGPTSGVLWAVGAAVVIAAAIAGWFLFAGDGPGPEAPATGAAQRASGGGGTPVTPAAVDAVAAPDPAAATPAVAQYATGAVLAAAPDGTEAKALALREHLLSLAKGQKLRRLSVDTGLDRRPLTADAITVALAAGETPPPLTTLEAAAFVVALAQGAGLPADVVEEKSDQGSATSITRKRIYARVAGVTVDPWEAEAKAAVDEAKLRPLDATTVRAFFQGLEALAAAEKQDFKGANAAVALGLGLAPDAPVLTFLKGQIAVLSGMVQFGIEDLERALAVEEDALGRFNLGVAYVQAQRFFKAHEALRRAIELDAKFAPAWLGLAQLHLARLAISPEGEQEGLIQSAQEAIEKARAIEPDAEGIAVTSAQVLLASDDERGAITVLDEAIRVHPERPQPYVLLGSLLANKGKWAELVSYLKGGLEKNPGEAQIRQLLLVAYLSQDRADEAERLLTDALAANPEMPDLRVELAGLLAQAGRKDDAHRLLEEEIQKFPESEKGALLLAQLDLDAGKPAEAAKRLDAVLESQPGRFEALVLRYIAAAQSKDEATQKKLLDRVATAQPNGRSILAQLLLEQGLVEEGAAVLDAVLRDRPGSPGESIMLYATYVSLGRLEDAARVRAAALEAAGDARSQMEAQLDQVLQEATRVHAAAAAAAAEEAAAAAGATAPAPTGDEGGEGDGGPEAAPGDGERVPSPGIDTGLGGAPGGIPKIDIDLKLPDAPGEKRDRKLPGGGPKIDLPDLGTMP